MEILSDATFRGNVSVSGGSFSVTRKGESSPLLETINSSTGYGFKVYTSEYIKGHLWVDGNTVFEGGVYTNNYIQLGSESISSWSDLNSKLSFAPSSLSSTVSTLCTKVDSLCTTVACIQPNTKHVFGSPKLPAGCTKFYFVNNVMCAGGYDGNKHYKFILNKWYDPVSSVQVFKGGTGLGSTDVVNEEVQMDVKQYTTRCSTYGSQRYFEATLASNTSGYDESEFLLVFDDFGVMCTTSIVPQ